MALSFQELKANHTWKPIANCSGRYILKYAPRDLSFEDLLGKDKELSRIQEFQTTKTKDTVFVVLFAGGGIISYKRSDGSFVHTLNDNSGLARKLADLGIDLLQA